MINLAIVTHETAPGQGDILDQWAAELTAARGALAPASGDTTDLSALPEVCNLH